MAKTIWLARHGERLDSIDPNWKHTAPRPFDPPLTPAGHEQAKKLGRRLAREGLAHVFASPFLRTIETAHHVAEAAGVPLRVEAGLSEWLQQHWFPERPPMLPLEELTARFPRLDATYRSAVVPDYPEDLEKLFDRCNRTVQKISSAIHEPFAMIGHGASVVGVGSALTLSREEGTGCPLCALFKVVHHEGAWRMELRADESHLA